MPIFWTGSRETATLVCKTLRRYLQPCSVLASEREKKQHDLVLGLDHYLSLNNEPAAPLRLPYAQTNNAALLALPNELIQILAGHLDLADLKSLRLTCRQVTNITAYTFTSKINEKMALLALDVSFVQSVVALAKDKAWSETVTQVTLSLPRTAFFYAHPLNWWDATGDWEATACADTHAPMVEDGKYLVWAWQVLGRMRNLHTFHFEHGLASNISSYTAHEHIREKARQVFRSKIQQAMTRDLLGEDLPYKFGCK